MKIKNIGSKIVNVGSTILMPGDEAVVNDSFVGNPAIKKLAEMNYLMVIAEEKKEEPKKAVEPKAEEPEETEAPAEEPVKKTTSRRKAKTSE